MEIKTKKDFKRYVPYAVRLCYKKVAVFLRSKINSKKTLQDIFSEIYFKNKWGGRPGEFYSGPGSEGIYAEKFCNTVNDFIKSLGKKVCVVDVGCGDFRIGGKIISKNVDYIGVDVVLELISRNKQLYEKENVKFLCLDVANQELPDGDVCLLRQVLQHLSNKDIKMILDKVRKFKYVFVTETYPTKIESCNKDQPSGQDTRFYKKSAVCLEKEPFNVANVELVMSLPVGNQEEIKTFFIKNFN